MKILIAVDFELFGKGQIEMMRRLTSIESVDAEVREGNISDEILSAAIHSAQTC